MGMWLERSTNVDESVLDVLEKGLSAKESMRKVTLKACLKALHNEGLRVKMTKLTNSLCKIINNNINKITHRSEVLRALLSALWLASVDSEADNCLEENEVWNKLLVMLDCPLFKFELIVKYSIEDFNLMSKIIQVLIISYGSKFEANSSNIFHIT